MVMARSMIPRCWIASTLKKKKKKNRFLRSSWLGKWKKRQYSTMILAEDISQAKHWSRYCWALERAVWSAFFRQRQRNQLRALVKSNRHGWSQLVRRINRWLGWFLSFFFFKGPQGEKELRQSLMQWYLFWLLFSSIFASYPPDFCLQKGPNPLFFSCLCIDLIVSNPEVLVVCTWVAFSPNEAGEVV